MKPYVYISTGKSKDVQREAPTGARVAIHYPEIGRTVELWADGDGAYQVTDRPAPGYGGGIITVASGRVALPAIVDQILKRGLNAAECIDNGHAPSLVEAAVAWIEAHPTATEWSA